MACRAGRQVPVTQNVSTAADSAMLLFHRKVYPPNRQADIVLSGSMIGVPLVQGARSVVRYTLHNVGTRAALSVKVWEAANAFPATAFHFAGAQGAPEKGNAGPQLVASWERIEPGAFVSINCSVTPLLGAAAERAASMRLPLTFGHANVYPLLPAQLEYRWEAPRGVAHTAVHQAQSSTEGYAVVESAAGHDRRVGWHLRASAAYGMASLVLAGVPYVAARRWEQSVARRAVAKR